jgi:transposase-like protein
MGKVRRDFTREFKIEGVRLSYQTDKSLDEFAEDMGISRSSLSRWRSEFGMIRNKLFLARGNQKSAMWKLLIGSYASWERQAL